MLTAHIRTGRQARLLTRTLGRILAVVLALAACQGSPPDPAWVPGDQGTWGPWEILDASHAAPPAWTITPPAGKVVAEGADREMRAARRLANLQLVQNAGLEAGVQVQSEFIRFDTEDSFRATARTAYQLNAEFSVEVLDVYWERRQVKGIQLGLPTTKTGYRVVLLGALVR